MNDLQLFPTLCGYRDLLTSSLLLAALGLGHLVLAQTSPVLEPQTEFERVDRAGFAVTIDQPGKCVSNWLPIFGDQPGTYNAVRALTVFDDGSGRALYAGGAFTAAGGVPANRMAEWDGSSWAPLGSGVNNWVRALAVFDNGAGPALYAGGAFTVAGGVVANRIARWDGSNWAALGGGTDGDVCALTVFDDGDGPALYAGGSFLTAGDVAANGIAKWDGSSWTRLGSGMNSVVYALTVFDDGSGPELYAGGAFKIAGGVPANRIAKWDGASWAALGNGMGGEVFALTAFDVGSGPALYAGGFGFPAGNLLPGIAKWDGSSWAAVGGGVSGHYRTVDALAAFDDGGGPALYAGGDFAGAGGVAANRMAKWDGSNWEALGNGLDDWVFDLAVFDDGDGPALYAGGQFTTSGGMAANSIAKWGCAAARLVTTYCTAGTSASGCNAVLFATGAPSATATSGFDLLASDIEGAKDGLFFYGTNGRQANSWGNGTSYQCVGFPVKRTGLLVGTGMSGLCDGSFSQDLNARWCATCPQPLHNPGAGALVQAQLWYRDPMNTSNQATSLSNAVEFTVRP